MHMYNYATHIHKHARTHAQTLSPYSFVTVCGLEFGLSFKVNNKDCGPMGTGVPRGEEVGLRGHGENFHHLCSPSDAIRV
jgi:hypothetical protein